VVCIRRRPRSARPGSSRSPELDPVENLWQFIHDDWLGNRIFPSYPDILDQCCDVWNKVIAQPWRIMSIGMRRWAHRS
jgi:putative transposase